MLRRLPLVEMVILVICCAATSIAVLNFLQGARSQQTVHNDAATTSHPQNFGVASSQVLFSSNGNRIEARNATEPTQGGRLTDSTRQDGNGRSAAQAAVSEKPELASEWLVSHSGYERGLDPDYEAYLEELETQEAAEDFDDEFLEPETPPLFTEEQDAEFDEREMVRELVEYDDYLNDLAKAAEKKRLRRQHSRNNLHNRAGRKKFE